MVEKLRVAVVFGGKSGEHDVSIASATSIMNNLDRQKYEIVPVAITVNGSWAVGITPPQLSELEAAQRVALESSQDAVDEQLHRSLVTLTTESHLGRLISLQNEELPLGGRVDIVFPALHGTYGEDGTLQGLLEMANVPYVGCGVTASALGMDKEKSKILLRSLGLPIVDWVLTTRSHWSRESEVVIRQVEQELGYPCFVKPVNLGSSVGISKARGREQLIEAVQAAAQFDRRVIIERGIDCREFSCAVLGNDEPLASVVGEIVAGNDFSDYNDKYVDHKIQFIIPSHLPQEQANKVRDMALLAYTALDLNGVARVDFFFDKATKQFYLNEVNTMPGFTSQSLYPQLWAASGLPYADLLDRMISLGFEYYEERQKNRTTR